MNGLKRMTAAAKAIALTLGVAGLMLAFAPALAWAANEVENNGSLDTANAIQVNSSITGNIETISDTDLYKFELTQAGNVVIQFDHAAFDEDDNYWEVDVLDYLGNQLSATYDVAGNVASKSLANLGLPAGKYYVRVTCDHYGRYDNTRCSADPYSLKVNFTASDYFEKEPNYDRSNATPIKVNTAYKGSVETTGDTDLYKFELAQADNVVIQFDHAVSDEDDNYWEVSVLDYLGDPVSATYDVAGNAASISLPSLGLPAGKYYVKVTCDHYGRYDNTRSNPTPYTLKVVAPKNGTTVKTGWAYENGGYYYYNDDGTLRTSAWISHNGKWYYLGQDGRLVTDGWVSHNGKWYCLDASGNPVADAWVRSAGKWYYLGADGAMVANAWVSYGGRWYYMGKGGAMVANGWVSYGGKWYYLNASGNPVSNAWVSYGGKWYRMDASGNPVASAWVKSAGKWYYLGQDGAMAANGWVSYNGKWYYLDASGNPVANGWVEYKGTWYHFDASGVCDRTWKAA